MECQHEACNCTIEGGSYCSEYCRTQSGSSLVPGLCECGHDECGALIETGDDDGPTVLPPKA